MYKVDKFSKDSIHLGKGKTQERFDTFQEAKLYRHYESKMLKPDEYLMVLVDQDRNNRI